MAVFTSSKRYEDMNFFNDLIAPENHKYMENTLRSNKQKEILKNWVRSWIRSKHISRTELWNETGERKASKKHFYSAEEVIFNGSTFFSLGGSEFSNLTGW